MCLNKPFKFYFNVTGREILTLSTWQKRGWWAVKMPQVTYLPESHLVPTVPNFNGCFWMGSHIELKIADHICLSGTKKSYIPKSNSNLTVSNTAAISFSSRPMRRGAEIWRGPASMVFFNTLAQGGTGILYAASQGRVRPHFTFSFPLQDHCGASASPFPHLPLCG